MLALAKFSEARGDETNGIAAVTSSISWFDSTHLCSPGPCFFNDPSHCFLVNPFIDRQFSQALDAMVVAGVCESMCVRVRVAGGMRIMRKVFDVESDDNEDSLKTSSKE